MSCGIGGGAMCAAFRVPFILSAQRFTLSM